MVTKMCPGKWRTPDGTTHGCIEDELHDGPCRCGRCDESAEGVMPTTDELLRRFFDGGRDGNAAGFHPPPE